MRIAALGYVVAMRLFELAWSRRNLARLNARPVPGDGMGPIATVHVLWILGLALEPSRFGPVWPLLALFAGSEAVRFWCIAALGPRWNVRVVAVDLPPVRRGPYRFLRHPNYAAVVVGMAALPLALGLWVTPAITVPLKLLALRRRLRVEERELRRGLLPK